jgi:hypothetical protein
MCIGLLRGEGDREGEVIPVAGPPMAEVTSDITRNCLQLRALVSHGNFEVASGFRFIIVYYRGSAVNVWGGPRVVMCAPSDDQVQRPGNVPSDLDYLVTRHVICACIYGVMCT